MDGGLVDKPSTEETGQGQDRAVYVDRKGERSFWKAHVRLGAAYLVAVDCVGAERDLVLRGDKVCNFVRPCAAGSTAYFVDDYPPKRLKTYEIQVQAPPGAAWAVMVTRRRSVE
ncbi:hypothetical protein [Nonomuraea sp. NPDC048826]|uniref:hypothetical protein n=1 Tax=Nonomuraea sp. NPDC048826 TaxID=3364347 RepID=UPI00371FA477